MVKVKKSLSKLERGDIIKISFDPIIGHEQAGYRPALVLSGNTFHKTTGFALCVPVTSKEKGLLFEIEIRGKEITGVALPHGARMLDLTAREFQFVETANIDAVSKAQIIMKKVITE